jgi:hypothetical protein
VNWFAVLFTGRSPEGLHRFLSTYVNYAAHFYTYLSVAADRYPGFLGEPGYEVDVTVDPPATQNRWTVGFRLVLLIPAALLVATIAGGGLSANYWSRSGSGSSSTSTGFQVAGILGTAGVLTWFYSLFAGRAPEGVVRLARYAIHYAAQFYSYVFVLTDRYPNSDPAVTGVPRVPPPHPIVLHEETDSLERNQLTVFFRLILAIPHLLWLLLWGIAVFFVAIVNWFATLIRGGSPDGLHAFLSQYQRYAVHVYAYLLLVADAYPGFMGTPGTYPVEVEIEPPVPQSRVTVAFRLILAIPAFMLQSAIGGAALVAAVLAWFAGVFTGRVPRGLRNLAAFSLRYEAQAGSYGFLLLTSRYPYAGPPAGADSLPEGAEQAPTAPPPEAGLVTRDDVAPDDPRGAWRDSPFLDR